MNKFITGDCDLIAFVHTKGNLDVVTEYFGDIDKASSELVVIGGEKFEVIRERKMRDYSSVDLEASPCSLQQPRQR